MCRIILLSTLLRLTLVWGAVLGATLPLQAQEQPDAAGRQFRIGTGGVTGTYFTLGSVLAGALSEPPGSPPCRRESDCGIPGMVATTQTSAGSIANVAGVESGDLESGFVQSDVAFMAYRGEGPFAGKPHRNLRAIASLYTESLHLVARAGSRIGGIADLKGRRVAVDEEGSGTLFDVRLLLMAFNMSEHDFEPVYVKYNAALALMRAGKLDAMFVTGGVPMQPVQEATGKQEATLVAINGQQVDALVKRDPFLTKTVIPADTYGGQPAVATIGVTAQWLVPAATDERIAYGLARVLFAKHTMDALAAAHPRGADVSVDGAFSGLVVPLHPGALRFYREQGLAPADVE